MRANDFTYAGRRKISALEIQAFMELSVIRRMNIPIFSKMAGEKHVPHFLLVHQILCVQ